MEILVDFGGGMKVNAHFKNFTVNTDQAKKVGGDENYPEPYAYFLSSLATCAGFFVLRFCQTRELSTDGIQLRTQCDYNKQTHLVDNIHIEIEIPPSFPEKYAPALIRATHECSVKKTLLNPPNIEVTTKVIESV